MQKEYQQKIDNNLSKWPIYHPTPQHLRVLKLLTDYIQSFAVNSDFQFELIKSTVGNLSARKLSARNHLLARHPSKSKLVNVIVESQLFADYLDDLEKRVEACK